MTDPATIATGAVLAKKVALVSGIGGTTFAAIAWWEHLAYFWPISPRWGRRHPAQLRRHNADKLINAETA